MSDDQLSLVPGKKAPTSKRVKAEVPIAEVLPVARVIIDSPLPHLDHTFDYAVPQKLSEIAQPGVRVRVRFAGKLVDGFLIERAHDSEHVGALSPLANVISPEQVLTPETLQLCQAIASRQAGVLSDVIGAAIPTRHARAEAQVFSESSQPIATPSASSWDSYRGGAGLISRACDGLAPRASVGVSGDATPALLAEFALSVAAVNRGVLIVVPDRHAIDRVMAALVAHGASPDSVAIIAADDGPERRYAQWLSVLRGQAHIVVGTRSAVFAPVKNLGAICVWDEWNSALADPQAPYWNARDVAIVRSSLQHTALMFIGNAQSTDAVALGDWMVRIEQDRITARDNYPTVRCALDEQFLKNDGAAHSSRIPVAAHQMIKRALAHGPVLVHVARPGYVPGLVCARCRAQALCTSCSGSLVTTSLSSAPSCVLCGVADAGWKCPSCKHTQLRAFGLGSERTAEELGRAFPGIPVRTSSGDRILRTIDGRPAIIVATSGAAPIPPDGYAAALLLDGNAMLSRPDLRATEQTFAHWMESVSLVRPRARNGEVLVVADPEHIAVQALIKNDAHGLADRECALRREVSLPPAVRLAVLTGVAGDIDELIELAQLPEGAVVRGPVPVDAEKVRFLLSVKREDAVAMAEGLRHAAAIRSAKRQGKPVNVRIDPIGVL